MRLDNTNQREHIINFAQGNYFLDFPTTVYEGPAPAIRKFFGCTLSYGCSHDSI